jgi:MYXO-CTERM domain-containing protein
MKYTVGANGLAAGTVISSLSTNADFGMWTLSGLVGTGTSQFQQLSLSSTGDQVTVFTSTNTANPMFDGFTSLWNFDNTGALENATSSSTGSWAPGLGAGSSTLLSGGLNYAAFNFAAFSGGTAEEWAARFADASNWITGTQTTSTADGSFAIVPAPGALALLGVAGLASRRRR